MCKIENINELFYDKTRPCGANSSVRYKNQTRFIKAKEQQKLPIINIEKIIEYTNQFLNSINMEVESENKIELSKINLYELYRKLKEDGKLNDKADIVWMKFTKDGYLGVVATSNDINFDMPGSKKNYKDKNKYKWKYNTSGIIIHHLNKKWDDSFVLIFPLKNIPKGKTRGDIERAIGNYLIKQNVPILDFYSHRY